MLWRSLAVVVVMFDLAQSLTAAEVTRYARFRVGDKAAYGIVEGDRVREISGSIFGDHKTTDTTYALKDVKLLVPTAPKQIFALAGNYKSHLNQEIPEKFKIPQPFLKTYSSLVPQGANIVIPKDSNGDVHYEAEMVIVIGKKAKDVPKEQALEYVFGVTCGNDVSERYWQNDEQGKDIQWWRAKGADSFGPCGPYIARGLDYDNLLMTLRINGEEKQKERTNQMIHGVAETVSFISRYVTLHPGDLIFTGTTGKTTALKPGDTVEVEIEGVGTLKNKVVKER